MVLRAKEQEARKKWVKGKQFNTHTEMMMMVTIRKTHEHESVVFGKPLAALVGKPITFFHMACSLLSTNFPQALDH